MLTRWKNRIYGNHDPVLGLKSSLLAVVIWALLIVYPIPNVIALRNSLLLLAVALTLPTLKLALKRVFGDPLGQRALSAMGLFYAWMVVVAVVIDHEPLHSLREILGQWITALLALLVGLCFPIFPSVSDRNRIARMIAVVISASCMLHVVGHDSAALWQALSTRGIPTHFFGITDHPANIGYVVTLLLPILGADLLSRSTVKIGLLPWAVWVTYLCWMLSAAALITAGTRNSQFIFLLISVIVVATLWWEANRFMDSRTKGLRIVSLLLAMVAFVTCAVIIDGRWHKVAESVSIGWDTKNQTAWIKADGLGDIPKLRNGDPVEMSAYSRSAFLREGLLALQAHPFGTEISKNAFKNLVILEHGEAGMCCVHNGIVDLGISAGVPAILLWCAFLYFLIQIGRLRYKKSHDLLGYALMLLVVGYSVRMFLDSTLRDHIILQFMLCAGMLLSACVRAPDLSQAERAVQ